MKLKKIDLKYLTAVILSLVIFTTYAQDTDSDVYTDIDNQKAVDYFKQAQVLDWQCSKLLDDIQSREIIVEDKVNDMIKNKNRFSKEEISIEKNLLSKLKKQEKKTVKLKDKANDNLKYFIDLTNLPPKEKHKKIIDISNVENRYNTKIVAALIENNDIFSMNERVYQSDLLTLMQKKEKKDALLAETNEPSTHIKEIPIEEKKTEPKVEIPVLKDVTEIQNEVATKKTKKKKKEKPAEIIKESPPIEVSDVKKPIEETTASTTQSVSEQKVLVTALKPENYKKYSIKEDVLFNPPKYVCKWDFDGKDEFTGKNKRELPLEHFFSFSDDAFRLATPDKEYVTCFARLTMLSGGYIYMNLEFTILSKDAQRTFGIIEKGTPISIKLVNGENVTMGSSRSDLGVVDLIKGTTTYKGQYLVPNESLKSMSKYEVDRFRMVWSTGFDDYEIYNVDFFMDRLKCFNP
jgi:hypothetical protein